MVEGASISGGGNGKTELKLQGPSPPLENTPQMIIGALKAGQCGTRVGGGRGGYTDGGRAWRGTGWQNGRRMSMAAERVATRTEEEHGTLVGGGRGGETDGG